MTLPTSVVPDVPEGTLDPAAGLNLALNPLRVLVQAVVIEVGVDSPPGASSLNDGDCVIVGAGTDEFAGKDNHLARWVEDGEFWEFYEPGVSVWVAYNLDDKRIYVFDASIGWSVASGSVNSYDLGMFFPGNPGSSQLLFKFIAARNMQFPANFAGSIGHIGTNPTSTFTMDVSVNGSVIGTIEVSTGGAFTFATTGGVAIPVSAGERIEIEAPSSADGTAADIAATLVAQAV